MLRRTMIHPTAIVAPDARLGAEVTIGPYCVVESGVEVGDRCVLLASCILKTGTVLGAGVTVHSFATIGGDPQYLKFDPATRSGVDNVGQRPALSSAARRPRARHPS